MRWEQVPKQNEEDGGMALICKNFVKVLFPFRYEKEIINHPEEITVINDKGKEKRLFVSFEFEGADLRNGVQELFAGAENTAKIMASYRVEYDARACIGLPRRKEEFLSFYTRERKGKDPYAVAIGEIGLYLFESEVGFIEMECCFDSPDVSDYISCNYFLAEVKAKENYFIAQKRVWNADEKREEITEVKFSIKELLQNVLGKISGVKDFYTENEWSNTKEKGLIYSYLFLEEKTEGFDRMLHNIRNNYKESYKVVQRRSPMGEDPSIRKQFENSYWVTSYNGTVNVSHKTDTEVTNQFFEDSFFSKMHNVYYVLFLAVLHQRFALLKSMMEMVEVSNLDLGYEDMKQQLVEIREYKLRVNRLKYRAFFEKPSYVQHINDYYELMKKSYCVDELYSNLSSKLESVERICDVYVNKIQKQEERISRRRNAKIEIFVSVFGLILGLTTVFSEALSLLERVFGISAKTFSIPLLLMIICLSVPSVTVVVNMINKIGEIRELTKEIKRENAVPKRKAG